MRWSRCWVTLVATAMLATACVTPALNRGAYVQNGKAALDSAISETGTALLAISGRLHGDSTLAYADTVLTESETALAPVESSFGGVDPPSHAEDGLREQVLAALGDADDALASARIAIRRDDHPGLRQAASDLTQASSELEKLRKSLG